MPTQVKNTKQIGIIAASALVLIAAIFFISLPFRSLAPHFAYWLGLFVVLVLALSIAAFGLLFAKDSKWIIGAALAPALAAVVFFSWHWLQVVAAALLFISIIHAVRKTNHAREERLSFSFRPTVRPGLRTLAMGLVVVASMAMFASVWDQLKGDTQSFYKGIAQTVVRASEPFLRSSFKGFTPTATVDEFLKLNSLSLGDSVNCPQGAAIDDPVVVEAQKEELSKLLGSDVTGQEQVSEILLRIVQTKVEDTFAPIQRYVPFIYALLLFLSLRFLAPIVVWLAAILGGWLYTLAIRAGFIRLEQKEVTIEIPELT